MVTPQIYAVLEKRVSGRKGEKEGLNALYGIGGIMWVLLGLSNPSIKMSSLKLIRKGLHVYEDQLKYNLGAPNCISYQALIDKGYLKKKHWIYAGYMATLSSLPILHTMSDKSALLEAILGKTSIGASTKLLDNLNDSIQTVDEALESLREYEKAMINPLYDLPSFYENPTTTSKAVNTAYVMGNWVPKILIRCNAPRMQKTYAKDVKILIEGQVDSIRHKSLGGGETRTIQEYLTSIAEKSIGDVWLDVDLSFLEDGLGGLDNKMNRALDKMKEGYGWIFKSSLIYDDVQDLSTDLKEGAINSALLLGLEEDIIKPEDIVRSDPNRLIERLDNSGVTLDTIRLADLLFLKGVRCIEAASTYHTDVIDWKALLLSFRFVRLFNLRKILIRKKNKETLRLFLSSVRDFREIEAKIPQHILKLGRHI
ncbi:MAG: hypothetical protein V3W09_05335 [Nitrososphaerales archaeon]